MPQASYQQAWLLDLTVDGTTYRAGSTDVDATSLSLAAFYARRIANAEQILVTEQLSDWFSGIDEPSTVTVILDNADDYFPVSAEWRGATAVLSHIELTTSAVTTVLTGIVVDMDHTGGRVLVVLSNHDPSLWETLIPRQVTNPDEFPSAGTNPVDGSYTTDASLLGPSDNGLPISIICGPCYLSPPFCGRDETSDPGGYDFAVAHTLDANGNDFGVSIQAVYWDSDPNTPGLETITAWEDAPGNPVYVDTDRFTVDDVADVLFYIGLPIRFTTTASAGEYVYTMVRSLESLTVILADAVAGEGLAGVQCATDYLVERGRYWVSNPAGVNGYENLLTVRTLSGDEGGMVVQATSSLKNPASLVREILENTAWGLAQTVDTDSFADAVTAVIGNALSTCLGAALGDREQRSAGVVLKELLMLVGGRLSYSTANGWQLTIDAAPDPASVTFELGGTYNNIVRVETNKKATLQEAIKTLHLRFGGNRRLRRATDGVISISSVPTAYPLDIRANVLGVGSEQTLVTPWINEVSDASRVLARIAKQLKYGDQRPAIVVGQEGRGVALGDLVHYVNAADGVDGDYRVWRKETRLGEIRLSLMGYDSRIFTYDAADTTTVTGSIDVNERRTTPGTGQNLVLNSDFSALPISATISSYSLPGWVQAYFGSVAVTTLTVTRTGVNALACKGGGYLTLTTGDTVASEAIAQPTLWTAGRLGLDDHRAMAVEAGKVYIASVYADVYVGWQLVVQYRDSANTLLSNTAPSLRVDPSDTNGRDWKRYYVVTRAPSTAAWMGIGIRLTQAATTYNYDAVQVEQVGRRTLRPTHWRRHTKWGIDPAFLQPGELTIRAPADASFADELEHGTKIGFVRREITITAGANVTVPTMIPVRSRVDCVTTINVTDIIGTDGFIGYAIGYVDPTGAGDPYVWADLVEPVAGTRSQGGDVRLSPGTINMPNGGDLLLTAVGGTFVSGTIYATIHYTQYVAPTG